MKSSLEMTGELEKVSINSMVSSSQILVTETALEENFITENGKSLTFSDQQLSELKSHLDKAAKKWEKYGYDIKLSASHASGHMQVKVITLSSRNLGLKFYLFNTQEKRSFFSGQKKSVRIYRTTSSVNEFSEFGTTSTISKALDLIDRFYCKTAFAHLY